MKIEPLIGKRISPQHVETADGGTGYEFYSNKHGQLFEYDEVKAAVEFYNRYNSCMNLLVDEHPEYAKVWFASDEYKQYQKFKNTYACLLVYRDWLFKYSFKDVIEVSH